MKKLLVLVSTVCLCGMFLIGCGGKASYHGKEMPDPAAYSAHFGDIDKSGDGKVKWYEFKAFFPDAAPEVFMELDLNDDGVVDHDEWHQFMEAHGLTHD